MASPNSSTSIHPQTLSSNQGLRLLGSAQSVNLNAGTGAAGDTPITIINSTSYVVTHVVMTNASISLTTALAGLFTAPAAGGTAIVANAALSGMTTAAYAFLRTIAAPSTAFTGQTVYLNTGTAQGAAATCDVYVYGFDLQVG